MDWAADESSKALLASIFESSVDAIVGLRLDGTVMAWNAGAERLYGWSAQEIVDGPVYQIVPDSLISEMEFLLEQVGRGDVVRDLLTRRRRKDGEVIDVSLSVSPIRTESGEIIGAVKMERDVTRRRRRDAISDGQRRLLESLTRTGRLERGLEALLDSLSSLTAQEATAAVMRADPERSILTVAASQLPPELEKELAEGVPIAPRGHPSGEAAFSYQGVSIRDLRGATGWSSESAVQAGLLSCCSTPIVAPSGEVLGTLDLYRQEVGDPSAEDLEVVSALSQTASLVMDRFRVFEELRTRRATLAALNKINTSLAVELDSEAILRRVADESVALLKADMGAFFCHPAGESGVLGFRTVVVSGAKSDAFEGMDHPGITVLLRATLEGLRIQRFEDVTKDPRFGKTPPHAGLPPGHPPVKSFLSVPVQTRENGLIGLLLFGHADPGVFGRWHEDVVAGIASQAALALDNALLYEQVHERAEGMAEADRKKDEFLAVLGHELRNPLSAITASLDVLKGYLPAEKEAQQLGSILRRQVRHMGRLVDDLLDLGRITRGEIPVRLRVQDVRKPVRRAAQGARSYAARQKVTIHLDLPDEACWANVDEIRVEQVVGNLIHNAVKFAPDSEIDISVRPVGKEVLLIVQDAGRGIARERLQDIFDLFTQLDGAEQGGLGLGLSLVKQLVRLHEGRVTASSDGPGKGACFEVRLPLSEAPAPDAEAAVAPSSEKKPSDQKLRIVLAEDQEDSAQAMVMLLERWGHEVRHAANGRDTLALVEESEPDVAILDIGLPDMDGWEIARKLRTLETSDGLRIAVLSGLGQEEDLSRSVVAGVDEHFVKPVNPKVLQAWLASP